MRIIHNLGSSPERVLASERLSPGELRKLHLALGVNDDIELLVMDEPTNHLDLPSVECLETALAAAQCALLLVSHDRRFLDRLCPVRWLLRKAVFRSNGADPRYNSLRTQRAPEEAFRLPPEPAAYFMGMCPGNQGLTQVAVRAAR